MTRVLFSASVGAKPRRTAGRYHVGAHGLWLAMLVALGAVAAGCGGDSKDVEAQPSASRRLAAFCAVVKPGEVPESYVGSAEHVADIEAALAVAPAEIERQLTRFKDFVAANVDPARPDSQLRETWPPQAQDDSSAVESYVEASCGDG